MAHRVTLIPGDGIGPEVVDAARRAIEATGVPIEWDLRHMGSGAFSRTMTRSTRSYGLGTPGYSRHGRTFAYRSSS